MANTPQSTLPAVHIETAKRRRGKPRINDKISPDTFPTIFSRIMLNTNTPQEPPTDDIWDYTQILCFLYLENYAARKRVYHMFVSTDKDCEKDYEEVRKVYKDRKDLKIVNQLTENTLCARTLYERVKKLFSDAKWNKQGNVFELDMTAETGIWAVSRRINKIRSEEHEKLFNYIRFLSFSNT
ncbi:uncharacterized protein [Drosophila bipectinata]|uniref:uncharacterized protein n=1 Tax=Drosophila bipectinata TaxID=42026 RepID=UPI001C89F46A|nr:uncharacterized protein LOC122321242 [Drosophila bipectinata]